MNYYKIALPKPLYQPLIYHSPEAIDRGQLVLVPLLSGKTTGLVLSQVKKNLTLNPKKF